MIWQQRMQELGIQARSTGKYLCPQCSNKRNNKTDKCLSVSFNNDAILYKCHNCGWSGKINYSQSNISYFPTKTYFKPSKPVVMDNKAKLINYALKRGISCATIEKYKLELNNKNEIIFQYFKDGELTNVKYRTNLGNGKKNFRQEKDTEKTFYGMDEVKDETKELVIVEGEWDVLAFSEVGIDAVSVPQGASENKLECIENCWGFLQRFENFIICTDNDDAGEKLKHNLINRLGKEKCKVVDWNLGEQLKAKDANELLLIDKIALKFLIESANFLPSEYIQCFGDFENEIFDFWKNGYVEGLSTGWSEVDNIFKIKSGKLMVITGIPSRGKSFFTDNLLFNLTRSNQWRHLICSFEITKTSHFARIASMFCEKAFKYLTESELKNSIKYLRDYFFTFQVDRLWNVEQIIEEAEIAIKKYGIKTLVIDPYSRLNNEFKEREDLYIGKILTELILFAKRMDILIIFIAHPQKIREADRVPTMYDISGSSNWYNLCDYGIIIHRNRNKETSQLEDACQVIVAKVKDFELGNPSGGVAKLFYNKSKFKLENLK